MPVWNKTIPEGLFKNCTNVENFMMTFAMCGNLQSIPEDLFESCKKVKSFMGTFYSCPNLTGNAIPLWERVTTDTTTYKGTPDGTACYEACTGLSNYAEIPTYWKQQ